MIPEKEILDKIKEQNPEGIFEGEISFIDEKEKQHTVTFIFRKPVTADIEVHQKTAQRNPIVANLNMLQSLIIYPEPGPIIDEIREYPAAYGKFIDEVIAPFFGAETRVKKRNL
ncbi:MAG: hypothetical protein JXB88_26075 [Spirochaetales bacterium]|nr:hypothetical protein [Spirochaetales bacterium]